MPIKTKVWKNPKTGAKHITFVTPLFTFKYPKLNRADTKFVAEGVYEVQGDLSKDVPEQRELLQLLAQLHKDAQEYGKEQNKGKKAKEGERPIKQQEDGSFRVKAKMKAVRNGREKGSKVNQRPKLLDARGQDMSPAIDIWSGSVGRLEVEAVEYYTAALGAGISLRLLGAQIKTLVNGSSRTSGLDALDDGFDASEENEGTESGMGAIDDEAPAAHPDLDTGAESSDSQDDDEATTAAPSTDYDF
jgi:hypothetical protein